MVSAHISLLPPEVLRQTALYLPFPDIHSLLLSGPRCFRELRGHTIYSPSFAPWRRRFFAYQRIYLRTMREAQDLALETKLQPEGYVIASGQIPVRTVLEQELEEASRIIARDLGLLPSLTPAHVGAGAGAFSASQQEEGPGTSSPGVSPVLLPIITLEMVFCALEHLSETKLRHLRLPPLLCPLWTLVKVLMQRYPRLGLIQKFIPVPLLPQSSSPPGSVAETAAIYRILTAYLLCTALAPNDILGVLSDALSTHGRDVSAVRGEQEMALVEYFHFLRLFLMMYEYDQDLRGKVPRNDLMSLQGRRMLAGRLDIWIRGYFRTERPLPPQPAQATVVTTHNSTQSQCLYSVLGELELGGAATVGCGTFSGSRQRTSFGSTSRSYPNSLPLDYPPVASQQKVPGPKLTKEQERIVGTNVSPGDLMKIRAYAGTGKTMSLTEYAKARPHQRFLYVAFNKSAQSDAEKRFPRNVDCKTMHSIAIRALHIYAPKIKDSLSDINKTIGDRRSWDGRMPTMEIPHAFTAGNVVEMLGLKDNTNMITSALISPSSHSLPGVKKRQEGKMLFPTANSIATCVKKALEKYWSSKDLELSWKSLPSAMIKALGLRSDVLLGWADKLWKGMVAAKVRYFSHDAYLKLLHLDGVQQEEGTGVGGASVGGAYWKRVNLVRGDGDKAAFGKYEVIMFDEAQDSNPSMTDIILRQRPWAGVIVVGDPYQKIYGFRGATNECFDDTAHLPTHSFYLTHSFRFGDKIAEVANVLLRALRENVGVNGVRNEGGVKRSLPREQEMCLVRLNEDMRALKSGEIEDGGSGKYTVIFRKNITLIEYALEYCISHSHLGHRIALHTARNTKSTLFALLRTAYQLFHEGTAAKTGALTGYKTWQELKDHVGAENSEGGSGGTDSPGLGLVVGLEEHIAKKTFLKTIATCEKMVTDKTEKADVILITTHQAKGQEWDRVVVAEDFNPPYHFRGLLGKNKHWREEMFMTYVAVTRAKKELIVGKGIAAWLAGEMGAYRFYVSSLQGKERCPVCRDRVDPELSEGEIDGDLRSEREVVLMGYECLLPTGSFGVKLTEPMARSRVPFGDRKDVVICDLCVRRWYSKDELERNAELVGTFPLMGILDECDAVGQVAQDGVSIGGLTERRPLSVGYRDISSVESDRVMKWVGVGVR